MAILFSYFGFYGLFKMIMNTKRINEKKSLKMQDIPVIMKRQLGLHPISAVKNKYVSKLNDKYSSSVGVLQYYAIFQWN